MIPSSLYCSACGASNATDRIVCFACEQPLRVTANDNAMLLQGRYRILTQVGKGGFGAVYRAEDTHNYDNTVAVKQINLRGLTPQETIEVTDAFNREVSLLSKLSHPNLPHIHDNFTDPEHWYLVMDFIEGETLESYLEAKGANYTASLDDVLTLGIQLCTVLNYLHTREPVIIFRDLKPANIMHTSVGKLYLIDFGIARSFKPGKLKDTIPFGSPGYAPPEQYGKAQTTPRADIYSLGALLHRLLTGDDPVDNPFHFAPLRIYGASGLTDLDALIARMTHIDANCRPTTIMEVKDELQCIADMQASPRLWHPPVGQTPSTFPLASDGSGQQQISISGSGQQQLYVPATQRKHLARRKFLVGGFAVTGLTIIGASGIANIVSALHSPVNTGPESSIGNSPSNQSFFAHIYTYEGHAQPVKAVAWSNDNAFIASASDDNSIHIWSENSAKGGATAPLEKHRTAVPATCLAWGGARDSKLLAFNNGKKIIIWDVVKNTTTSITSPPEPNGTDRSVDISTLAWSPDGTSIAFPTKTGVQLWNVLQGKAYAHVDVYLNTDESITSLSWSTSGTYIAVNIAPHVQTEILYVPSPFNSYKTGLYTTLENVGDSFVIWSPDGSCVTSVSGHSVSVSFFSENLGSMFYTFPNDVTALAWSHDSFYLVAATATVGSNATVYIWNVVHNDGTPVRGGFIDNSTPTYIVDTHGTPIYSLAWSSVEDNGEYIAIGADKAYLLEINLAVLKERRQQ